MWDYLRRSRVQGYFVPLSGGIDSCATAVITYSMCRQVAKATAQGSEYRSPTLPSHNHLRVWNALSDKQVIADARRMTGEPEESEYLPADPKEFCNRIFHTCYMGTENSSAETRKRAKDLAKAIGAYHTE